MKRFHYFIILGLLLGFASCKSQQKISERSTPQEIPEVSQIDQLESTARLIEASKQVMLGNIANAILLYAQAAEVDPRNSAALYELAKLHAQQGFMDDAEKFGIKAVELDPDNKFFNMLLADIYFAQGKNDQGFNVQKRMVGKYPTDLNLQVSFLSTLVYLERYEEAVQQIDYIEEISGFNNEMSLRKQQILMEMEKPELALEEAKRLVSYFPDEPVYLELLGELYEETGQSEKAFGIYQRMLQIQPDNAMALLLLADYYRNQGDDEKSFEKLRTAFASDKLGVDGKSRILASYFYMSEEDTLYARQAFHLAEIMLESHPDAGRAHAIYGDFLMRDKKIDQARESYIRATELDPAVLEFWQQLLSIEAQREDYQAMVRESERALEYFFEQPVLYFFNGLGNIQLKNYSKAISALKMGKDLSVDQPELTGQFLTLLGDSYYQVDQFDLSFQSYEQALELNPDDAYALNNYSYYLSLLGRNLDKAKEMSGKSLELQPDNASFLDTYGWILYQLGSFEEAEQWIKKALENSDPPGTVVLEHYGDVLYQLGQKDKAVEFWEKALDAQSLLSEEGSEFLQQKVDQKTLIE
jgi:tetratricopeptide (TPR) repeat protein